MSILFITPTDATIVSQLQPNQNFGPQENLFVGLSPTPNDVFRSLLNFDINFIPAGSTITNATLRLLYFQDVPGVQPLIAKRLLSSFSQNTVTWNTQPAVAGGYIYKTNLGDNLVDGYIYLDLTGLIQDWYSGLFPNNGLVLNSDETVLSLMGFKGYDDGIVPNWPTLIIEFEAASATGSIIPYASGGPITMTAIAGGLVNTAGLVGFGNSASAISALGGTIDLSGTLLAFPILDFAFSVPRIGTITSISAFFSTTAALALALATVTVTAQLYRSTTPDNIFTPIPGASVALSPTLTGIVPVGTILTGLNDSISVPVSPGDRLLMVFTITGTGITVLTTVAGYASAGITIE